MASKYRKEVNEKNRIRVPAPSGDKITAVRGWVYENGEYVFKVKKLHNHYEETQAARDAVDLKKILERYKAGDEDALERVNGFYMDTVNIPKTIGEMYDAMSTAQMVFDSMPIEIKNKYNNNPATFWKEYGTESFDNFVNDYRAMFILGDDPEPVNSSGKIKQDLPVEEVKTDVIEHE